MPAFENLQMFRPWTAEGRCIAGRCRRHADEPISDASRPIVRLRDRSHGDCGLAGAEHNQPPLGWQRRQIQRKASARMRRGHTVKFADGPYGGYQAIARDPVTGMYIGASESRKDGHAAGY